MSGIGIDKVSPDYVPGIYTPGYLVSLHWSYLPCNFEFLAGYYYIYTRIIGALAE
jgi:hypothetical protein